MSSKSDEKLTSSSESDEGSRLRPNVLRLVPRKERQQTLAASAQTEPQIHRRQSLRRHSDNNDDDPGPTAA